MAEAKKRSHHAKRTGDQQTLPADGMAAKKIPAINSAAKEYQEIKLERVAMSTKEIAAKSKLHNLMTKHELKAYRVEDASPPLLVELKVIEETVSVHPEKAPKADDE